MLARFAFALTTTAVLSMSLGCSTSWPKARSVSDPRFATGARAVRTVDILPMDLQVWTYRGARHDPQAVAAGLDSIATAMVRTELAQRGYDIRATMDWDGLYRDGSTTRLAMEPDALAATTLSLSTFGAAQAKSPRGQVLVPHLPVPLGTATRSDATLYVGGWAYSGKDKSSTNKGAKVAVGVLVGVLVVGVIILAIAGGKGGGGGLKGVGKAAGGAAKGVAKAASGAIRATGGFGRVAGRLVSTGARGIMRAGVTIGRHGPRIAVDTLDAFGRSGFDTHLHYERQRVDYAQQPSSPRKGRSAMLVEMTLIDNRTGRALWHARKRFPASPRKAKQVHKAVRRLMATFPESVIAGAPGLAAAAMPTPAPAVLQ